MRIAIQAVGDLAPVEGGGAVQAVGDLAPVEGEGRYKQSGIWHQSRGGGRYRQSVIWHQSRGGGPVQAVGDLVPLAAGPGSQERQWQCPEIDLARKAIPRFN